MPFEIPQSWCWTRICNITQSYIGLTYSPSEVSSQGTIVLRSSNIKNGRLDLCDIVRVSKEIPEKLMVAPNDIIICARNGSKRLVGKSAIVDIVNEPMTFGAFMAICKTPLHKYIYQFLQSDLFFSQLRDVSGTTTINQLTQNNFNAFLVPIPPIEEQQRIVERIEGIMPIADKYEKSQEALDKLNAEIFDKLKKSVLQEAIQGKLVPQDPNDEPASVLLERIKEEKAKLFKEGKLKKKDLVDSVFFKGEDNKYYEKIGSEVTCIDDEIPFEIPDSWAWIRLGNIFQHNTGKALNGSNQKGAFYDYITTSNLYWNSFVLGKLRSMPFTDDELDKCTVKKGDLLVCEGGDIGRSAIWNYDYDIRIQNHIHRLRAYTPICTMFVYYTLYLYKHTGLIGGKGIGIQGLSSNALHKLLLPLPSIAEQKRIVDKIEFVIASITRR